MRQGGEDGSGKGKEGKDADRQYDLDEFYNSFVPGGWRSIGHDPEESQCLQIGVNQMGVEIHPRMDIKSSM